MNCRACGADASAMISVGDVSPTHPGPFSRADYSLLHCQSCDVVYLDPLPTKPDLAVLYEKSVQFSDEVYTDPARVEQIVAYYGTCLDNHKIMPPMGGRFLEIGAGLAWVARAIKVRDATVITVAQDVTAECASRCPWVDRYEVGSAIASLRVEPFDLVSMTHVIEHLSDPRQMLVDICANLKEGGHILVTAPHRPTGWARGDGISAWLVYSYHHVPAHLYYLSETWFRKTAEAVGLELVYWNAEHECGQAFEAVLCKPVRNQPVERESTDTHVSPVADEMDRPSWSSRIRRAIDRLLNRKPEN